MRYKFGERISPLCSFGIEEPESPNNFFCYCTKTKVLWRQLQHSFQNVLIASPIPPESAIFGFTDHKVNYHLINDILFLFKY